MGLPRYDYAIIGAGIAGASLAAELLDLAPNLRVIVLEAEGQAGRHATGRSAAFWEQCYGGPEIVPLTLASHNYLNRHGFLTERGALYIAREDNEGAITAFEERFANSGAHFEPIGRRELERFVPGLKDNWLHAIWQPDCADIDVAGLHQHYLKRVRVSGAELRCGFRVERVERDGSGWTLVDGRTERITARNIALAAGAWADAVAELAGLHPKGIAPLRRTVAQLRTNPPPPRDLPLVLDIEGEFYFKPEAGRVWLSPHDETPSEPCDAAPEELDVALAIDRFQQVVGWTVEAVERRWAGLRSFAPDRLPVYGRDPDDDAAAWFAGQGGYGIQTAPAAARLTAQLLLGEPRDEMTAALDPAIYSPGRFD
jgi:D-arginine dehydrogenase